MHIINKKEYNYDTSYSKWKELIVYGDLKYLKDVKIDLDTIKKLIDSDFKDLSDKDFYNLISRFYSIYLTKDDILNILSKINNVEYNKFEKINSRMIFKDIVREGRGKDFSWWEETYQIGWIVAVSENLKLNSDYNYSKEEIEKMIKNKQIISFGKYSQAIGMDPKLTYKPEAVEKINILKIDLDYEDSSELLGKYNSWFEFNLLKEVNEEFSKEVYKLATSMIRKRLNKKKVLNECKKIVLFLNDNIHRISDSIQYGCGTHEDYKNLDLLKEITISHNNLSLRLTNKT